LVLADHRDFRDGVDAIGEALGSAVRFDPESVTCCKAALFHRGRGERRKSYHVTDGVDVGDRGAIVLVYRQPTSAVGLEPGLRQIELARGAGTADRVERLLGNDRLAAVEVNPDASAVLILDNVQFIDTFVEPEGGPVFPKMVAELVSDFLVDERQ